MKRNKVLLLLSFIALVNSSASYARKNRTSFSLMTYNAENLFDTKHDEGKDDYTYLPLRLKKSREVIEHCQKIRKEFYRKQCLTLDWNQSVLNKKLRNLGDVIKIADHGDSPDIVVLQEVENKNVLEQLKNYGLRGEGYRYMALIESNDRRGIDSAVISKYPLAQRPRYYPLKMVYPEKKKGVEAKEKIKRGILEVTLNIKGNKVRVLANHWQASSAPDWMRYQSAEQMRDIAKKSPYPVIATGDFNTHPSDNPHGINEVLLNKRSAYFFWDAEKKHYGEMFKEEEEIERGTYNFGGTWRSLDRIFVMARGSRTRCPLKTKCIKALYDDFKIVKEPFMLRDLTYTDSRTGEEVTLKNIPARYNPETGEGYSDHLPVVMRFEFKN